MKSHRILAAALLLCSIAACGQTPTGSDRQAQPAGASFDGGGYTIGSGGDTQDAASTGGYGMGSGYTEGGSDESTSTFSTQDAERGGFVIGSGN